MRSPDVPFGGSLPESEHTRSPSPHAGIRFAPPAVRILLATDGSEDAGGAVAVALALARERGATVEVISVLAPAPLMSPTARRAIIDDERRAQRRHLVDEQLSRASPLTRHWPVDLALGNPCSTIAAEANARFADVVVMGLSRHTLLDRVFHDETTLRVMRRLKVPLLAVASSLRQLPSRVVVALDFSRSSIHAAHAAAGIVADGGMLHLVHVEPRVNDDDSDQGRQLGYEQGVVAAFERLVCSLNAPPSVQVGRLMLEGPPFAEIEAVVCRVRADLLALGTTRHDLVERVAVGRLTSTFTREASISLLTAPPECHGLQPPEAG